MAIKYLYLFLIVILAYFFIVKKSKKSSFGKKPKDGLDCEDGQTKIFWNKKGKCYSVGNYSDLSNEHPSIGTLKVIAGPNTVKMYQFSNFEGRDLGTVLPGEVKTLKAYLWSVKIS